MKSVAEKQSIFKSDVATLKNMLHRFSIPATKSGSNVILGQKGKDHLWKAKTLIGFAIDELEMIE